MADFEVSGELDFSDFEKDFKKFEHSIDRVIGKLATMGRTIAGLKTVHPNVSPSLQSLGISSADAAKYNVRVKPPARADLRLDKSMMIAGARSGIEQIKAQSRLDVIQANTVKDRAARFGEYTARIANNKLAIQQRKELNLLSQDLSDYNQSLRDSALQTRQAAHNERMKLNQRILHGNILKKEESANRINDHRAFNEKKVFNAINGVREGASVRANDRRNASFKMEEDARRVSAQMRAMAISTANLVEQQKEWRRENEKRSIFDRRSLKEARPDLFQGGFGQFQGPGARSFLSRRGGQFGGGGRSLEGAAIAGFTGAIAVQALTTPPATLEQNIIKAIAATQKSNVLSKSESDDEFTKIQDSIRDATRLTAISEIEFSEAVLAIAKDGLRVSKNFDITSKVLDESLKRVRTSIVNPFDARTETDKFNEFNSQTSDRFRNIKARGGFTSSDFQIEAVRQAQLIALAVGEPESIGKLADALGDFLPKTISNVEQLDDVIKSFASDKIAKAFTTSVLSSRFNIDQTIATLRNLQGVAQRTSLGIDQLLLLNATLDRIGPSGVRVGTSIRRTIEVLSSPNDAGKKLINENSSAIGYNSRSLSEAIKGASTVQELFDIVQGIAEGIKSKGGDDIDVVSFFQDLGGTEAIKGLTGILATQISDIKELEKEATRLNLASTIEFQNTAFLIKLKTFTGEFTGILNTLGIQGGVLQSTGDLLLWFANSFSSFNDTLRNDNGMVKIVGALLKASVVMTAFATTVVALRGAFSLLVRGAGPIGLLISGLVGVAVVIEDMTGGISKMKKMAMEFFGVLPDIQDKEVRTKVGEAERIVFEKQLLAQQFDKKGLENGEVRTFNRANEDLLNNYGDGFLNRLGSNFVSVAGLLDSKVARILGFEEYAQNKLSNVANETGGLSDQALDQFGLEGDISSLNELRNRQLRIEREELDLREQKLEADMNNLNIIKEMTEQSSKLSKYFRDINDTIDARL